MGLAFRGSGSVLLSDCLPLSKAMMNSQPVGARPCVGFPGCPRCSPDPLAASRDCRILASNGSEPLGPYSSDWWLAFVFSFRRRVLSFQSASGYHRLNTFVAPLVQSFDQT